MKKNIFENLYIIVSQLKIIEHNSSSKRAYIDISNLNLNVIKNQIVNKIDYFKKLNSKRNIKFINKNNAVNSFLEKNKYKIKTNFVYEIIINIYEFIKIIIFQGNINFQKSSKNIMVKYGEGLDRKKRSDIFWIFSW